MTRREWLAALPAMQPARAQPNIIFILADDLGWGDLGCYGNRRARTPNIDRLAQQGIRFEQFYVACSVCSPSRSSFMTGGFTRRHGVTGHYRERDYTQRQKLPPFLDPKLPMLPAVLQRAGYRTAHFGKWHLCGSNNTDAPRPSAYGFDHHRVVACNGDALQRMPLDTPGWNFWSGAVPGPDWRQWRARTSELIMDEAIAFVNRDPAKPFFIQAWMFDTHGKLVPTAEQMKPLESYGMPFRIYHSVLHDMDRHIGRLLARLDELGIADNTLVLFSSDNGPEDIHIDNTEEHGVGNPGPFRGRKRSGYEGGVRVPLIARWPRRIPAGKVDRDSVLSAVDLLPTLTGMAEARRPVSGTIDGEDMGAALMGNGYTRRGPLMWDLRQDAVGDLINRSPRLAIRDGRWKLLMHNDGTGVELYDMLAGALEVDNVADRYPDVAKQLSGRLRDWTR